MKNIIATTTTAALLMALGFAAHAQDNIHHKQQYTFRPSLPPITHTLALKKQLSIDFSRQLYWGTAHSADQGVFADFGGCIFRNFKHVSDSRIGISYTPWEHITIGAAYIGTRRYDLKHLEPSPTTITSHDIDNIAFSNSMDMLGLSATYHRQAGEWWAWEARTSLSLGRGRHTYFDSFVYPAKGYNPRLMNDPRATALHNDELRYNLFNHSLEGAVSVFTKRKRLQLTLLVNAGYTLYFNARGLIIQQQVYEQLASVLNRRRATLYMDPALVLNINCHRMFSLQTHVGFPMGLGESELRTFVPTIGLGMSFRILGPGNFEGKKQQ